MAQVFLGAPNPVAYVPQQHDELQGTAIITRARNLYSWWRWIQDAPGKADMHRQASINRAILLQT